MTLLRGLITLALVPMLLPDMQQVFAQTDTPSAEPKVGPDAPTPDENPQPELRPMTPLPDALKKLMHSGVPLNQHKTVTLDKKKDRLLLHTEVACQDCPLEMFCCLEQTKEHESVVWLRSKAFVVHAGLLALGAKVGEPATFTPEFKAPSGQVIDIFVNYVDEQGKLQRKNARDWMRHTVSRYYSEKLETPPAGVKLPLMELRYDPYNKEILWFGHMSEEQRDKLLTLCKDEPYQAAIRSFHKNSQTRPMTAEFVFAGSYQFVPEGTNKKLYAAEGGQLICVANFGSSMIDVKEASSANNGGQSYEAWADHVPPRGTPVVVELIPRKKASKEQPSPQ